MDKKRKRPTSPPGGPTPKAPDESERLFEDLFVTAPPVAPGQADSSYVHEKPGFFARLFKRKPAAPEAKEAA